MRSCLWEAPNAKNNRLREEPHSKNGFHGWVAAETGADCDRVVPGLRNTWEIGSKRTKTHLLTR